MKNVFFTAVLLVTFLCILPATATKGFHFLQLTWHSKGFGLSSLWSFLTIISLSIQYLHLLSVHSWRICSGIIRSMKASYNLPQCITIIFSIPTSLLVCFFNYNKVLGDLWATKVRRLRLRSKHGCFWRRFGYWSLDEFLHDLKMAALYNLL